MYSFMGKVLKMNWLVYVLFKTDLGQKVHQQCNFFGRKRVNCVAEFVWERVELAPQAEQSKPLMNLPLCVLQASQALILCDNVPVVTVHRNSAYYPLLLPLLDHPRLLHLLNYPLLLCLLDYSFLLFT